MCELLGNNSLFVGQLYTDKSLTMRTCDLIFLRTEPPNSELLRNYLMLELIYFLNIRNEDIHRGNNYVEKSLQSYVPLIEMFDTSNTLSSILDQAGEVG